MRSGESPALRQESMSTVQVIKKSDTEELVTLWYQQPNGKVGGYEASVVHDPNENICIYGSCHAFHPSTFINWKVVYWFHYDKKESN